MKDSGSEQDQDFSGDAMTSEPVPGGEDLTGAETEEAPEDPSTSEESKDEEKEDTEKAEELSESSANLIIDGYWSGEAPKKVIQREKSKKSKVLKDW